MYQVKFPFKELSLSVSVVAAGDLSKIETFLAILQKQLPLSNVSKVNISNNSTASVAVLFYYAPFPDTKISPSDPLTLIPSNAEILITKLKVLKSEIPISTDSATLTPTPTIAPEVSLPPVASSVSAAPTTQTGQ